MNGRARQFRLPLLSRTRRGKRGALLIVALLICAVIGISITSYIQLGRTSLTVSNRALYNNGAMNLAENGLEEAMYSINQDATTSSYSWSSDGWTTSGTTARRKWTGTQFDQNATGEVRVRVDNYSGASAPVIYARSLVTLGGGAAAGTAIEKWIKVSLIRTSKFANGLVAKDTITFSGSNATVDSWESGYPTSDVKYSSSVKRDRGSVGSVSVSVSAVAVQNADIFGYAATGGALPKVGPNGRVGTFTTALGTMDMSRVSTDFSANFDPVAQPTGGTWVGAIGSTTLGATGSTTTYSGSAISLSGASTNKLVIQGDVTLYLTASAGASAITVTGNASIEIGSGASLIIYTAGDVSLAGNGVLSGGSTDATANSPTKFQLWGTSTSATKQSIGLAGNGVLSGLVYAPNASVRLNGNGSMMGSVVANDITVTGNAAFHYDESLVNFSSGNPFRVSEWNEITSAADRAALSASMTW